ncbi:MAG: HAMP domain-containing sensor histidine kinase [Candidatus Saccharimonadales bacterium]|jgi:signal transduction histidine kinase
MMSQHSTLFDKATLRLTAWYMVILMVISLLFSLILFYVASDEFGRALGPRRPGETMIFIQDDDVMTMRQQRINESSSRLFGNLAVFNIVVLLGGGALSYLLARRTLRPIQEAMELQARFSSDAAHELRTPLAVMQTETEVTLRDKKSSKESYSTTLQSNLDEVHRLRTLTDRLLLLANNHDMPLAAVQIEDVAVEAMNRSLVLAQAKKIIIDNQVGQALATANVDSLTDVLTILIDNAIKYSPAKSTIRLTSSIKDKTVLLDVIDEGVGISEADVPHVFDRFYRADLSRSKLNVEGHGLGLSIAKRLIEQQYGKIRVTSTPGNGSQFTIRLPKA